MFRCLVLFCLCQDHVASNKAFVIILQEEQYCRLLRFTPAPASSSSFSSASAIPVGGSLRGSPVLMTQRCASSRLPGEWDRLLQDPKEECVYYIADGVVPQTSQLDSAKVHVLEVSSPQEKRWKSFVKESSTKEVVKKRYMPLVSLLEMQHMSERVGSLTSVAEVSARYSRLGGSARNVLQSSESAALIVENAILNAGSLDPVLGSTMEGPAAGLAHIPSTLVHFRVIEEEELKDSLVTPSGELVQPSPTATASPFSQYEPIFASNYIRARIAFYYKSKFVSILSEMVQSSQLPSTSTLQGLLYEEWVHKEFAEGGSLQHEIRELTSSSASSPAASRTNTFNVTRYTEFDGLQALNQYVFVKGSGHYYKPISRSFGAVDFIFEADVGNMTLNVSHGISLEALLNVVKAMKFEPKILAPPVLRFLWFVPQRGVFQRFGKQSLTYKGHVMANCTAPAGKEMWKDLNSRVKLQQYVVLMVPGERARAKKEQSAIAQITSEVTHITRARATEGGMTTRRQTADAAAAASSSH